MTDKLNHKHSKDESPQILGSDLKKFRIAFTVREIEEIFSVDFSPSGKFVLFNTEHFIRIYELRENAPFHFDAKVDRFGAKICKFVNDEKVLHTSVKDNTIRLNNFEKKTYEGYYSGHIKEVHSLSVSKLNKNLFVSGSRDSTVRIWDTNIHRNQSLHTFQGIPIVAMHPLKQIIAVAYKPGSSDYFIEVVDLRFESIAKFDIEDCGFEWCSIRYSDDGNYIMVNTLDSLIMIIDMKNGEVVNRLRGLNNPQKIAFQTCFTPDSKYVIGGSENGIINVWNLKTSEKEFMLKNENVERFKKVEFNPQYMCFATIGSKFNLWIESIKNENE